MTDLPVFELERIFDAPRELVWRTWTEKDLLARWYGPGVETTIHELNVTPGGVWKNEMAKGSFSQREKMDYLDVDPPARLVWLHSITDENWQPIANPRMPDWPMTLKATVLLEDRGDKTLLRFIWEPHNATDAEIACFAGAMEGLGMGWGAGLDILAQMLVELQG